MIFSGSLYAQLRSTYRPPLFPTGEEISIVASTPIPEGLTATKEMYRDLVDCGFNMGLTSGSLDYFKQQFDLIGDLNFKYIIVNNALTDDKRTEFIEAFENEPKLGGWRICDEPRYIDLGRIRNEYNALYKEDKKNLIYINFAGLTSKNFTGPYTSLYNFLEYINKLIKPQIWSYDFYPIIIKDGKFDVEYDNFYNALEAFSRIAKKTKRPFWAYCESMAYTSGKISRPPATEAYLRFEAFSALAYGAQGIVYWTYGQRKSTPLETYFSALLNLEGKKSPAWYAAKKVNEEIKKYNDIFFNCNILDVRHTGDKIYKGTRKLSGTFGPFKMIRTENAGVLVSYIEKNGEKYVMIVNHDVENDQKIELELSANKFVELISLPNPVKYSWREDIDIKIGKGGYLIFKVMKK